MFAIALKALIYSDYNSLTENATVSRNLLIVEVHEIVCRSASYKR